MRFLSLILLLFLSLQGCFKEEEMIPPHEQGDLEEGQAALGPSMRVRYTLTFLTTRWSPAFPSMTGT